MPCQAPHEASRPAWQQEQGPATLGKSQRWGRSRWSRDLESGSRRRLARHRHGCSPSGTGEGQLPREGGWPRCSQPHPSSLVHWYAALQHVRPCAQSPMLATQSGLPGSFLLPGDFSAVRSYDCSLKGRALLAEGDIKFSLYKQ